VGGEEISDGIWRPVSACWKLEAKDRPFATEILNALSGMDIHDDRPAATALATLDFLQTTITSSHLERAKFLMTRILGTEQSMPAPSQIPEHLRGPICGLADDRVKVEAVAVAVKKLSPHDTQTLVDALDLVSFSAPPVMDYLIHHCFRWSKRISPL
jgi:hypothetical protein